MMDVRVRLKFQSTPLHYAKKCCFLFSADSCRTVGDLAHLVAARFGLQGDGVQLYLDDYLIPPNESSSIVRDNDLIEVRTVESWEADELSTRVTRVTEDVDASHKSDPPSDSPPLTKKARRRRKEESEREGVPSIGKSKKPQQRKKVKKKERLRKSASQSEKKAPPAVPVPVPVLKAVTKKSATGGTHMTFQSSSSLSSTSASSGSSDSEEDRSTSKPAPGSSRSRVTPAVLNSVQKQQENNRSNSGSKKAPESETRQISQRTPQQKQQTPQSSGVGSNTEPSSVSNQSPKNGGNSNFPSRRGKKVRGRGRGRGRVVGGDSDVLTVTSVVYRSPGEGGSLGRGRGRGLGRGWGSGWGVRPPVANSPATVKDAKEVSNEVPPQEKTGSSAPGSDKRGDSVWESSRVGFTRETSPPPSSATNDNISETDGISADQPGQTNETEKEREVLALPLSRDYSSLPDLHGAPRVGDTIAFKVLEISASCTPEVSAYKEAVVVDCDASSSSVTVRYTQDPSSRLTDERDPESTSALLRRVMDTDEGDPEEGSGDKTCDSHVTLNLGSLLLPKLVT